MFENVLWDDMLMKMIYYTPLNVLNVGSLCFFLTISFLKQLVWHFHIALHGCL